jgi:hypothetical protein
VDRAQVGVLEQVHQKRLGGFLQRQDRLRLPAQFLGRGLVLEGYFADLYTPVSACVCRALWGYRLVEKEGVRDEMSRTRRAKGSLDMRRSVLAW